MVASIFIIQGYDTFRRPERVAPLAEPVVRPLAERVPAVPAKTEQAVRINGAVQMVAGALLALGRFPRLSALAMAGTLVPTTLAGHRFWEADEDADQAQQRIHFLKNLSMFGGLLIAAADTAGNPSLAWRTRHAAKTARREASLVARTAKATSKASARPAAPRPGRPGLGPGRPPGGTAFAQVVSCRGRRAGPASDQNRIVRAGMPVRLASGPMVKQLGGCARGDDCVPSSRWKLKPVSSRTSAADGSPCPGRLRRGDGAAAAQRGKESRQAAASSR